MEQNTPGGFHLCEDRSRVGWIIIPNSTLFSTNEVEALFFGQIRFESIELLPHDLGEPRRAIHLARPAVGSASGFDVSRLVLGCTWSAFPTLLRRRWHDRGFRKPLANLQLGARVNEFGQSSS